MNDLFHHHPEGSITGLGALGVAVSALRPALLHHVLAQGRDLGARLGGAERRSAHAHNLLRARRHAQLTRGDHVALPRLDGHALALATRQLARFQRLNQGLCVHIAVMD